MAKRPELLIASGPMKGTRFQVGAGGVRLGRSSSNDVHIPDEELSRNHCLFEQSGDDGIRLVLFSGMGRECFSYLASRILPVRKITEKAVCYPKSARAMFKDGITPRIEALFRDGTSLSFAPSNETRGFYSAALDFIETGAVPTAESAVETAKRILCEYAF